MMGNMRDRLIQSLLQIYKKDNAPLVFYFTEEEAEFVADQLIESGMIVPPCKIGEILYLIQVDWNGKYNMQNCLVDSKITMLSILRAYEEKTVVYMSTDKSNTEQKLSELNGMRSENDL